MCSIIHQSTCIPIYLLIDISNRLKIMTWIARQFLHGMVVKVACDHRRCNKLIPTAARYVIFLHWWKKTSPLSCLISTVALPCSNPAGSAKYPYPSSDLYPAIKTCSASRLLLPRLWPNNLGSKLLTLTEVDPWALGKTKACVDFFLGKISIFLMVVWLNPLLFRSQISIFHPFSSLFMANKNPSTTNVQGFPSLHGGAPQVHVGFKTQWTTARFLNSTGKLLIQQTLSGALTL